MNVPYLGEILSLVAAVLWAFALVLFKRSGETVHPGALNTFKNVLALILYLPTIYLTGGTLFYPAPAGDYWLIIASGAIGLAVGDTLLFQSLNMIGAGRNALVNTLYSPIIIFLSFVWLGERMTPIQLLGVGLIVTAVLETIRVKDANAVEARRRLLGVLVGILALVAMGVGVVMIKPILDEAPLLWVIEIRMIGGVAALMLFFLLHPRRRAIASSLLVRTHRGTTIASSLIGAYLALLFWLGGMKYTQVSVASALNQTNTIFTLIFAAMILKEPITLLRVVAILTAVAGAMLVTFG